MPENKDSSYMLHLSDLHLKTQDQALHNGTRLESDLRALKIDRVHYLVISGDITHQADPDEYNAALALIQRLVRVFRIEPDHIIMVPGNHDLHWTLAANAYQVVVRKKEDTECIPAGKASGLTCNKALHQQRFANFGAFYTEVTGVPYPMDYSEQGILYRYSEDKILFLALNSAWQIDHEHSDTASINQTALARALDQQQGDVYRNWLKIALWHHPITGQKSMNDEFMELLMQNGFQICMHGHIHESIKAYRAYDDHRSMSIVGAGTFGSRLEHQAGIPLQYNILTIDRANKNVVIKSRKREKPDGVWKADHRWGDMNKPVAEYTIKLQDWTFASEPQL